MDDIAHAAEHAVRKRASCPRRSSILVHGLERLGSLLRGNVVFFPLLSLQFLLRPLLLDVKAPEEEDNNSNKGNAAHDASSNGRHVRS